MTKTELRQYIDKVLGNSIRCLLPSYWWKRLFSQVADRIDEVEQSASELVEASKMPIVGSEAALKKLDVEDGNLASVSRMETKERSFGELYQLSLPSLLVGSFTNCTEVKDIITKAPSLDGSVLLMFGTADGSRSFIIIVAGAVMAVETHEEKELTLYGNGVYYQEGHDYLREELSSFQYKYIIGLENNQGSIVPQLNYDLIDPFLTCVATLPTSDVYVKGNTWERLAKAGESGGSSGGGSITEETDPVFSASPAASITNEKMTAWDNKVDKVSGKQLSTEDFTSALKAKLEGLSNYDDTTLANAISGLETRLNTLVSGDASTAIESFNEIVAFLDGVKDTEDLSGIIASIEQQIAAKQDKITDLDTIRSGAAKGATALQSVPSEYVTESELAAKGYATTSQVNAKQDKITDLQTIREGAAKGATALQNVKTINGESLVGEGDITIKADVDTSTLATKEELNDLAEEVVINEEVHAAALTDLNTRLNALSENVTGKAATKDELQETVEYFTTTIEENEEVHAAAINDLNDRLNDTTEAKQDKLVSGTNIKTINGESILGSGDIVISGGGSEKEIIELNVPSINISEMLPNVIYVGRFPITVLSITSFAASDSIVDEYTLVCNTEPTLEDVPISLPDDIYWANGEIPAVMSGWYFELSIRRKLSGYYAVLTPFNPVE